VTDQAPASPAPAPTPPAAAPGELPGKRFLKVNAIALAVGVVLFFAGLAMPPRALPATNASPSPAASPAAVAGQK
jgi:hypothetical protein